MGFWDWLLGRRTDEGSDMVEMMKMLAKAPEDQRKAQMRPRIEMLTPMPEQQRHEAIRGMMRAFHSPRLTEEERRRLIRTRIEIIGEFPEEKRATIISSRMAAMQVLPDIDRRDMEVMEAVMPHVAERARLNFLATKDRLMKHMVS
jgi:hypothetical protein